jgi:hypothetical protein
MRQGLSGMLYVHKNDLVRIRKIMSLAGRIESLVVQLEAITGKIRTRSGTRRSRWYWLGACNSARDRPASFGYR